MLLSIIIITKNEEKYLFRLLASIKKQIFADYEIIVADNKSTDKTREIAASFGARVVEGGMPGHGRNRGVEVAKGEILLFLDADVMLPEEYFLEKALEEMKWRNFCVAAPLYDFYSALIMDKIISGLWNAWMIFMANSNNPSASGSCIFASKKIHDKIGGFDKKIFLGEDTDYVYRASRICRFGIIRSARVGNSPRRLHKVGYAKVIWQSVSAGIDRYIFRSKDYGNKFDYNLDPA